MYLKFCNQGVKPVQLTELRARSRECNKSQEIGVLMDALFDIAHDIPAAATRAFSIQLGRKLKSLKTQLSRAASNQDQGGDYGCLSIRRRIGLDDYEKRKAGGHKVRLTGLCSC